MELGDVCLHFLEEVAVVINKPLHNLDVCELVGLTTNILAGFRGWKVLLQLGMPSRHLLCMQ